MPSVPLIVRLYGPPATSPVTERADVFEPLAGGVTGFVANLQTAPAGQFVTLSVTAL